MEQYLQFIQILSPIISIGVGIFIFVSNRIDRNERDKAKAQEQRITECFRECDINKDDIHKLRSEVSTNFAECKRECEEKRKDVKCEIREGCKLRHELHK
jgi:hypothetical protein